MTLNPTETYTKDPIKAAVIVAIIVVNATRIPGYIILNYVLYNY